MSIAAARDVERPDRAWFFWIKRGNTRRVSLSFFLIFPSLLFRVFSILNLSFFSTFPSLILTRDFVFFCLAFSPLHSSPSLLRSRLDPLALPCLARPLAVSISHLAHIFFLTFLTRQTRGPWPYHLFGHLVFKQARGDKGSKSTNQQPLSVSTPIPPSLVPLTHALLTFLYLFALSTYPQRNVLVSFLVGSHE